MEGENSKLHPFARGYARISLHLFFEDLKRRNPFQEAARRARRLKNPWPAPYGEIPVLWSAPAMAKLCLQFLRGFEGDLVLRNLSFLGELPLPLKLPFYVEDRADNIPNRCDHEGSPTRSVLVFKEGRPKALAVDKRLASELAVRSTGHCRRESFQSAPTIGFWTPRLRPELGQERPGSQLMEELQWGISVQDLEVLHFHPQTAEIRLRLTQLFLVHHGAEGESIAPVELSMNLIDLLQSLSGFSDDSRTEGFHVTKNQQRFLTEVTTPSALSHPISIPGSVPASHYW
jgi:predicted Zn-dependent protease